VNTAAVILAAGESRRMGFPKALLQYRGETFVDALIGRLQQRCSTVIVVLGASAERIRASLFRPAVFVVNQNYLQGQTSSMQCGLRAVPPDADGVLFTLVDHPAVTTETIRALLHAPGQLLRVPRYQGRRGHPIWFSRDLIPEFLAVPAGASAKDVVHAHIAATTYLDLDDPGIVADIDDPEAYRALTGADA
jgi:molybdenum cofactor cytidylyltransferase